METTLYHSSKGGSVVSLDTSEFLPYESVGDDIALIDRSDALSKSTSHKGAIQLDHSAGNLDLESAPPHARKTFADIIDKGFEVFGGVCVNAAVYLAAHNPFTTQGRQQLRNTVLRSGPAYHAPSFHESKRAKPSDFSGWRMGAVLNIALLLCCLLAELIMLIVAVCMDSFSSKTLADGVLYRGSCARVKQWTSGLSILLNIIATLMIASSNYIMQCLSAPSETELRHAHKNGRSLQLGISSPFNIVYMSLPKTLLWWVMGLTSIPVHLLFNSAFFSSLQTNNYALAVMTADARNPDLWSNCTTQVLSGNNDSSLPKSWTNLVCQMARNQTEYEFLENDKCIERYSQSLISQYSNVILLSTFNASDRPENWTPKAAPETLYDGLLGYTVNNSWSDSTETSNVTFENELLDMAGLMGIFTSFDYQGWKSVYRYYNNISNFSSPGFVDYSVWMCNDNYTKPCTGGAALNNASNWDLTPWGVPVDGCLSRPTLGGEACQLEYSLVILFVVIACDIVKIVAVIFTLRLQGSPLITIGDAVAIFLRNPEEYTREKCLMDQNRASLESDFFWFLPVDFTPVIGDGTVADIWPSLFGSFVQKWSSPRKRWFHAASGQRWSAMAALYLCVLIGGGVTLYASINSITLTGAGDIWTRGFNAVDPNAIFTWTSYNGERTQSRFLQQVMLINAPQLILSFLYYMYNGMLTAMHSAEEWARFATQRKALRVSVPEPGQRSTYWLNLPWSYSIPLIITSTLLHYLVSKSLYLVKINVIGADGLDQSDNSISACGYSTLMSLFTVITLVVMASVVIGLSFRPLNAPVPLVGTASLAISAACHHPNDPETEARKPLLWGVTRRPVDGKPGHCSLSSEEIEHPVPGELYS